MPDDDDDDGNSSGNDGSQMTIGPGDSPALGVGMNALNVRCIQVLCSILY